MITPELLNSLEEMINLAPQPYRAAMLIRLHDLTEHLVLPVPNTNEPIFYLSGPMSGMPDHNFPAFNAEAERLRGLGYKIVNPVEINGDAAVTQGRTWDQCLRRDITALIHCHGVLLLPGWENSKGANLEVDIAQRLGMRAVASDLLQAPPRLG